MDIRKLLAYAAIYVLWGASFLAIRQVVAAAPPFVAAAFRFTSAGVILIAYSRWRGMALPSSQQLRNTALLGLVMFAGDYGCLFWAERVVPSGLAAVIAATIPVWVMVAEWLVTRDRRPGAQALLGVGLGIAGVVLLTVPAGLRSAQFSTSALVLLLGTFFWAGGTVASRRLALPRQITMSSGLQMAWGGVFLFLLSFAAGEPAAFSRQWHWRWPVVFAMAYLVLFASIVAFSAYVWLIARDAPARVASYAYVNPVIALFLGASLAKEQPTGVQYAGAALVLAGVAASMNSSQRTVAVAPVRSAGKA